jgi:Asp-tRNA(Asn)/Glu-tRNA(Gln) amidotransferase A subunit family amidase
MFKNLRRSIPSPKHLANRVVLAFMLSSLILPPNAYAADTSAEQKKAKFEVVEATITDIQKAILAKKLTSSTLVQLYLDRIKAYNGTCVSEPNGILGVIATIPHAGQINALMTLNLRPATRLAQGFGPRKARSMTDLVDNDPAMPDAFEVAQAQDAYFAQTGKLIGPLHGVVMAIKDAYDTFDMRTTSGADAFWGNDRPPTDAFHVKRLRAAGAIILAKANMGEYQGGGRSSFGGTNCNVYDTERASGGSSAGSGTAVSANLVTCASAEETGGSILSPSRNNGVVGMPPTRELMSAAGMIQQGLNTRVGPICRTVEDTARIMDVIAGYDPDDELTAYSVGRLPKKPYASYAKTKRLDGIRIGVLREFGMDKAMVSSVAHYQAIDLIEKALVDLRALGATIVDPGPGKGLFQSCVDRFVPAWRNRLFTSQFPPCSRREPTTSLHWSTCFWILLSCRTPPPDHRA